MRIHRPKRRLARSRSRELSVQLKPSPTPKSYLLRFALLTTVGLGFSSCVTQQDDPTDLDGPMFGESNPTTFVVASEDGSIHTRDLARVARVLRRYKTLDAAERALVKTAVGKRLQGLIAIEVQRADVKYRVQREAIRRLPDEPLAARRLAELDVTIRREAVARVAERLGNLVAIPLKTSDNRSAVAFAKISGNGIEVANDAGEIDRSIASLIDGEGIQTEAGRVASYVDAPPIPVAPAP